MSRGGTTSAMRATALITGLAVAACAPSAHGPASPAAATTVPPAAQHEAPSAPGSQPLIIGETFTIDSRVLGETRRVNVFVPTVYGQKIEAPMPVLYMPDGGLDEDFLHIVGLVQVLVSDGSMRPFLLVGIPNTSRRRDLTGPTSSPEDRKIAPVVGGSTAFRRFIRDELMPAVRARYRTTDEAAVVGESLAGLFVVETFFVEPDLFKTYIAIDPSLWWNGGKLVSEAGERLASAAVRGNTLFVASSSEPEMARLEGELARAFAAHPDCGASFTYRPMPDETHGTIYHPAALAAFRTVFAPPRDTPK